MLLLNVERFDQLEVESLENFAKAGGGVGFFLGEKVNNTSYNEQLFRDGKGIFPAPLGLPTELLTNRVERTPDLVITDHPVFNVFTGERNSFLSSVSVFWYYALPKAWQEAPDPAVHVIARLRNNAPLALEKNFGDGRVIAFLTKAGPGQTPRGPWNNWARGNPSYVVALLELLAYLSARPLEEQSREVGSALAIDFGVDKFQPLIRILRPAGKVGTSQSTEIAASPLPTDAKRLEAVLRDTDYAGIYAVELTDIAGQAVNQKYSFNVDGAEGDLRLLNRAGLATRLPDVKYEHHLAADLAFDSRQEAGMNLGEAFMWLLAALLVIEQLLAYAGSYHLSRRGATA